LLIALPLVAFGLLVIVLLVGIQHSPQIGILPSPLLGRPAPSFELPVLNEPGEKVLSSQLHGQWYVLNVWGTWCPECRAEHATLLDIQQQGGVTVVGLDWKDDDEDALKWLTVLGNPYGVVLVDHDGHTVMDWGVYGAPETFLVNPEGVIVHKQVGALTPEIWRRDFASRIVTASRKGS
jgi:cytochrome c biogenesis protein CcmG/thiol:disulfide interchange protein DsbE